MATLVSNQQYSCSMGGFVFYQLNGKTVVRVKRPKMTEKEKKLAAKTRSGKAAKSTAIGSKFGRALREIKAFKHQADTYYHSKMTGFITSNLMTPTPEKGGLGTRTLLPENVHKIKSFTPNSEFPKMVYQDMRKTTFVQEDGGITAVIPNLPIELLVNSKASQYRVWVSLVYVNLESMSIVWNQKVFSAPVAFGAPVSHALKFNPPKGKPNEVLMALVGVQSLVEGKRVEDVKMHGFLFMEVDVKKAEGSHRDGEWEGIEMNSRQKLRMENEKLKIGPDQARDFPSGEGKLKMDNGKLVLTGLGKFPEMMGGWKLGIGSAEFVTAGLGNFPGMIGEGKLGIGSAELVSTELGNFPGITRTPRLTSTPLGDHYPATAIRNKS